jgi:ribosomal protein S4
MTKPTQLSFEEHEETAQLIREFRNALFFEGDIRLSSRYFKKSKITELCRKLDNVLFRAGVEVICIAANARLRR